MRMIDGATLRTPSKNVLKVSLRLKPARMPDPKAAIKNISVMSGSVSEERVGLNGAIITTKSIRMREKTKNRIALACFSEMFSSLPSFEVALLSSTALACDITKRVTIR
jgi:hypothetical protein